MKQTTKETRINIRVSPKTKKEIEEKAGMTVSSFLLDGAEKVTIIKIEKAEEILKILCNLNSEVNISKMENPKIDFGCIEKECERLWQLLKK